MEILGDDRALAHRRFAGIAKKALTVAGLLTTRDTMVLQAFVLFLVRGQVVTMQGADSL